MEAREKARVERRLAAILAADVAGYSRLIEADEEGALSRLKTTGDGLLVEFASVVDALRCAVEMQTALAKSNDRMPPDRRIAFRIGINVGDIVVEDGDIFGDGVNVAARLEGLAEPGGICVSARVREDAAGKLDLAFEDIGEQSLKNIARPVRVYALRLKDGSVSTEPIATPQRRVMGIAIVGAAAVAAVLVVATGAWWLWPASKPASTAAVASSTSVVQPLVAQRLSIIVLPFANLSSDPEQQYFADGITEDVTTDLSRIRHSFVISRNTAFTYRSKPIDTKQIGRELSVRYVLEGSVRRSGNKVRVNAQLIDAETDAHLWAEQFDGDMKDLLALQNEITSRIAVALNVELINREAARRPTIPMPSTTSCGGEP